MRTPWPQIACVVHQDLGEFIRFASCSTVLQAVFSVSFLMLCCVQKIQHISRAWRVKSLP